MTDARTPDVLRPGSLVGSWRIEGYAGRGSYGLVFRARGVGVPRAEPVALKVAAFPYEARFLREAEVLSRFRHPSIPRLLHFGWWIASPRALYPYLVLEWIRGWPLYEWARMRQPSSRQVLQVLAQMAGALEVLHAGACLHRDVKGDNIRVGPEGRAVLLDYGSSTWKGAPPLTETLMPPNTPEYRSPEALRFQWGHGRKQETPYEARPADDVYALGVTAYRLVTSTYPPQRQEPPAERPPVEVLNERVVPEMAALIERMLAEEPKARGRAREAAQAMRAAAAQPGAEWDVPLLGPVPMPVSARTKPPAPAWTPWPRFVAVALVLAAVGMWWLGYGGTGEQVSEVVQVEAPEAEEAPDIGAIGLGEGGVIGRVLTGEAPMSAETVAVEMPKEPLPGQRRGPCRRGEVEIKGGCWAPWLTRNPPCGDDVYEWNGGCYLPRFEKVRRVPTTEKHQ